MRNAEHPVSPDAIAAEAFLRGSAEVKHRDWYLRGANAIAIVREFYENGGASNAPGECPSCGMDRQMGFAHSGNCKIAAVIG